MEMASYSHPAASDCTVSTMRIGVSRLPEGALRGSDWPVARILNLVPPMSTTRMEAGGRCVTAAVRCGLGETRLGAAMFDLPQDAEHSRTADFQSARHAPTESQRYESLF